ncbi:DNA mismatch repair endonuclease MutL [Selenihalanaerobacter shriftii]|uniref:DNA mismatch repair protein MutL n=1 Tax=Selenihalanaerobacter shriftii TaxID=142842 RepID=A0A1T4M0B2_9FIRM|nr:DNA mismatch repair endonuclease MutL [Selenihalanaerobacter shriftii]SJZ60341.1 DNA mismatch repair protein MutL [Selenihalanaerobacter shriftii]
MANQIKLLSEEVINKIAAGEVINRPSAVVKELVENSIDAESDKIEIRVKNGGKDLIQIIDNGQGMSKEDAKLALQRHATSKIKEANDLFSIRSLGFRGEALPSIAAISRMEIKTRTEDKLGGTLLKIVGGKLQKAKDVGCPVGTNIVVRDLFFNTPVRYKYLKTTSTEMSKISDIINRLALAYPEISFKLSHNQRKLLESPGNGNRLDGILSIYSKEVAKNMIKVEHEDKYMKVNGYVAKPNINRASRKHQSFFINRRYIKSRILSEAVSEAYHTLLGKNRYPIVILTIKLNPILVDVNVHPTKMEVNFSREKEIFTVVRDGVKKALDKSDLSPEVKLTTQRKFTSANQSKNKDSESIEQPELELTERLSSKNKKKNTNQDKKENKAEQNQNINQKKHDKVSNINNKSHSKINNDKDDKEEIDSKKIKKEYKDSNSHIKELESDYESNKTLTTLFPLGQIDNTYIVAQGKDGCYIIDQHAAHERILYNQLFNKFESTKIQSQPLLIPIKLELTRPEVEIIKENIDHLENLGFEIEPFGGKTYLIRAVPQLLHKLDTKEVCLDIVDNLLDKDKIQKPTKLIEDLIIFISCRSAIKSGDKLVSGEMERLLQDLEQSDNKYTCPHGRPTIIHLSQSELAKKFERN